MTNTTILNKLTNSILEYSELIHSVYSLHLGFGEEESQAYADAEMYEVGEYVMSYVDGFLSKEDALIGLTNKINDLRLIGLVHCRDLHGTELDKCMTSIRCLGRIRGYVDCYNN